MPAKRTILTACATCGADVWSDPRYQRVYCTQSCGLRARRGESRACTPVPDRFWPRVQKSPACWLTTGSHTPAGYGTMSVPKDGGGWRIEGMHRVAWWLATGEWPAKGQQVCHNCPDGDNPACVRNDDMGIYTVGGIEYPRRGHLWLGPAAANHLDMFEKGRGILGDQHAARVDPSYLPRGDQHRARIDPSYLPRGEDHVNSKTTVEAVRTMRQRYALGGITMRELAEEYGLTLSNVSFIIRRITWKHIE